MGRFFNRTRRRSGPLRAAIYGFCHAQELQKILAADPRVQGQLEFVDECFKMTDEAIAEFVESIAPELDVLIYQRVQGRTLGHGVSAAEIRTFVSEDCVTISFPVFRCDLYTPHFSYPVPDAPKPPFDYLDFGIVDQYLRAVPLADALPGARSLEFDADVVDEIREQVLADVHGRDFDDRGPLDVTLGDVVRDNFESEYMFHTINHPGPTLMHALTERTITQLWGNGAISSNEGSAAPADPFSDIHLPMHPSVQRALGIEDTAPLTYKGRVFSDEEAVATTYDYLDSIGEHVVVASMDRFLASHAWVPKIFT
jgi:hypothetical protein